MNNVEVDTNADDEKNNHILLIPKKTSNDKNNKLSNRKRKKKESKINLIEEKNDFIESLSKITKYSC